MEENRSLTNLEVLSIAIKSEIDAQRLYNRMKEKVNAEDLQQKLDFLIAQEERHEQILREVYEKKFPEVKLAMPPKAIVPMIDDVLAKDATLKELFEAGMQAEKMAEEFYSGLADKTNDMRAKKTLLYMANMEGSHYAILEAEWNQIERMKTEEANEFLDSEGLMHFGP
ncbi:MAG: ferritin family protein [Candidatus Latescibacterota bacterium]|jgi:rubrerythrin